MADTTRRATLIISAKDDASSQIGENALKFTELNSAIELGKKAVEAFKQVYDFAKEGAAIQRIGEQWQATADQFGINGEAALKAIDKVTNGTVDDEDVMKIATRELTQNVVANGQQLTDFFGIARAMTVRFGGDIVENSRAIDMAIETGMSRQLKARGIVVNFAEAYKEYADKLGVAANSLSDETKMEIRRNEVLAQGEVLVKKVGDTGSDSATKFEKLDAAFKNIGDELHVFVANAVTPVLTAMEAWPVLTDSNASALDRLHAAQQLANQGTDEQKEVIKNLLPFLQAAAAKEADLTAQLQDENKWHHTVVPAIDDHAKSEAELVKGMQDVSDAFKNQMSLQGKFFSEEVKFGDKQAELTAKQKDLSDQIDILKISLGKATQGTQNYIDTSKKIDELKGQWDGVNKDILANQKAHDEATKHIIFDYAQQRLAVDGFTDVEIAALESLQREYGFTSDSSEAMSIRVIKAVDKLEKDKSVDNFTSSLHVNMGIVGTDLSGAARSAGNLQERLAALHDKTITITTEYVETGASGPAAGSSGKVGHATGGMISPGEVSTVGERGMEMAVGTANGTLIIPMNSSNSGAGGGITVTGPLTVNLNGVQNPQEFVKQLNQLLGRQARLAMAGGAGVLGS